MCFQQRAVHKKKKMKPYKLPSLPQKLVSAEPWILVDLPIVINKGNHGLMILKCTMPHKAKLQKVPHNPNPMLFHGTFKQVCFN